MLQIKHVSKQYVTGDLTQKALNDVSLDFRDSEFVAILGHSGSGKTTMLNIIGGLDTADSGALIINGISTEKYKDRDWDTYRNHTIGFIFQSYNLIPHQSVLANVELALTLSGVSKAERKRRAKHALAKVGLEDQIHKRPNQLSGGQMQRVAIARALVNDPEILLADEPTGALDSDTGTQVMELLKEIAHDRLVIMVTHNSELADRYASRIVRLKDGCIVDDTDPYSPSEKDASAAANIAETKKISRKKKNSSMSFFTALGLSLNNLSTKKGRTFLTSFAGSIGIIGIALILALSNGIQNYVNSIQRDTLTIYPLTIERSQSDMLSIMMKSREIAMSEKENRNDGSVHLNPKMYDMFNAAFGTNDSENNLVPFKAYLDEKLNDESSEKTLSEMISSIQYQYNIKMNTYVLDDTGEYRSTEISKLFEDSEAFGMSGSMMSSMFDNLNVWTELLPGRDGEPVSEMLFEQYDLVAGSWPQNANEIVLIIDENDEMSDVGFYALGIIDDAEIMNIFSAVMKGESIETEQRSITYDDILATKMILITESDCYNKVDDRHFEYIGNDKDAMDIVLNSGYELKISGIVRPNPEANASSLTGIFGYTYKLVDYVIEKTENSDVVKAQRAPENADYDVLMGMPFAGETEDELSNSEKASAILAYFGTINEVKKTEIYTSILSVPPEGFAESTVQSMLEEYNTREAMIGLIADAYGMSPDKIAEYLADKTDEEIRGILADGLTEIVLAKYAENAEYQVKSIMMSASSPDDIFEMSGYAAVAAQFDMYLASVSQSEEELAKLYDSYMPKGVSNSSINENLDLLGDVDKNNPSSISIYAVSFDDKKEIEDIIKQYNDSVSDEDVIKYTDYVALLMSGVTTMIDAVSYGLIAFVSISLVVSSIMIGIITYISVLERTKEIGILRAIGASKRNVSSVFTAETLVVGLIAGLLGVAISALLCLPISSVLRHLSGINELRAVLTWQECAGLTLISMLLTLIAGLIPSGMAAKKDPVAALRSE